jgi:hypothetical protein
VPVSEEWRLRAPVDVRYSANPEAREERHMTSSGWNDPAEEEHNPHRAEERRHTRDELEARMRERRVELMGDESDEEVLLIVNAVEDFEARLAQLGEDSFVNTPESSEPDDERLVLPKRRHDESAERYAARIVAAAERLL